MNSVSGARVQRVREGHRGVAFVHAVGSQDALPAAHGRVLQQPAREDDVWAFPLLKSRTTEGHHDTERS